MRENKKEISEEKLNDEKILALIENSKATLINITKYDEKNYFLQEVANFEECRKLISENIVNWIDVVGISNTELLKQFGECFNIHPLVIEDIQSTDQRLKIDYFQDYLYIVIKSANYFNEVLELEQVSIILGKNFVVTFQESLPNQFDGIYERIKTSKGRIRNMPTDYLAYVILDLMIDNYFIILEKFGDKLEELEDELVEKYTREALPYLYKLKKDALLIRKSIWPLREVLSGLTRSDSKLIKKSTMIYLRDVYDHTIQIIDTLETYREMLTGLLDIFLSTTSNRMNEIMKVLTIIATIFIPLTFLAGIYGMNFQYMPELTWLWSYPILLIVMLFIVAGMLLYFRRKKWL